MGSKPHEDRLRHLKDKEAKGLINAGEKIEMTNIEKHLATLRPTSVSKKK